jgi:signal transduction histidine kinase
VESAATEGKLPRETVRALIVWGLAHDYKRVLRSLTQLAHSFKSLPMLSRTSGLFAAIDRYEAVAEDIGNLLDTVGNALHKNKTAAVANTIEPYTSKLLALMDKLIEKALKIQSLSEPDSDVQVRGLTLRLVRHTRRARQQITDLWEMPISDYDLKLESVNIRKEIMRNLNDLSSIFSSARGSIRENVILSAEPIVLYLDRTLFSIAISNIIANAVVHSKKASELLIRITSKLENTSAHPTSSTWLELSISDNGPGIAPEDVETIFKLFGQGKQGLEADTGSGLGLTFAKFAMDLMGGAVVLEPTAQEGATFVLRFPVRT